MKCEVPLIETVDTQEYNAGVTMDRSLRWRERIGLGSAVDSGGSNAESIRSSLGDAKELLLSLKNAEPRAGRQKNPHRNYVKETYAATWVYVRSYVLQKIGPGEPTQR